MIGENMGFDYFVFYTEASLVCVIILSMILITDRIYNTKQEKKIWFDRAIFTFILYFISDACWAAMLSGLFPKIRFFAVLFNFTNYILMSLMGYGVFTFIAVSGKRSLRNRRRNRYLSFLPVILTTLIMTAAYIIKPLFWIDADNELNPLYFPLMFSVPSMYLLAGFIISVKNSVESDLKEEKEKYLVMGSVPFGVMAFGMVQVVALNAPTFCFGCTIMWIWFYIQSMQAMISVDDLTKLNNRGQINRFLEQLSYSNDTRTYIMMIDINKFKGINDIFGHAEGDRALIIVSDALRLACARINASIFLGRYGGDEFTLVIQNTSEGEEPEQIIDTLRSTLSEKQKETSLPYSIDISIGYDVLKDGNDTVEACMKRADEKLYIDKHRN